MLLLFFILFKSLLFRIISEVEENSHMLSKWAQFSLNRLPSKSILLKYATLMSFDSAATLMLILLQA